MTDSGNLLGPEPTLLPADPAVGELEQGLPPRDVVRLHPESSAAWAAVAAETDDELQRYAFARVGYHRGLDALRRSGWKGHGPIPWDHDANRGFLLCLAELSQAAGQIGETAEQERCEQFLVDSCGRASVDLVS